MPSQTQIQPSQTEFNFTAQFHGSNYVPELDKVRLTGQIKRVFDCMADGSWRTLQEIEYATRDGQSSISAQLRNLRKPEFGLHTVTKRRRGDRTKGLFEYSLTINKNYIMKL